MKFNSFLESLRGIKISHQEKYTFSTEALSIEQLSQPINNEIREKFYDYTKHNDFIEKLRIADNAERMKEGTEEVTNA